MVRRFQHHTLSLVLFGAFLIFIVAQSVAGFLTYNQEQREHREPRISYLVYLKSGHFLESTMENWESEFLAIGALAVLSIVLRQRGSPESKPVAAPHQVTGTE